jgi:NAD(P)-dependent dehydrogenase (short-subunit alcohol dehydrogenase family)
MAQTVLITGANRGLGLELARQYAADGWRVIACCRRPDEAGELQGIGREGSGGVSIHRLDVTRPEQIAALQKELAGQPIDLLFNNAGVSGGKRQEFGEVTTEPWLAAFQTNTIGPLLMVQAFAGQVATSDRKVIACMGTQMASIGDNRSGNSYTYRSTKAALHMVVKSLAVDLRPKGIIAVVLHPGWVQTDMGGAGAILKPAESVRGLRRVLASLTPEDSGRFLDYTGRELPW